jgi:hypothetical protein
VGLALLVAAVGPGLAVLGEWVRIVTAGQDSQRHALGTVIGFVGVCLMVGSVRAMLIVIRGYVEAWPDGLYSRLTLRPVPLVWERIDRLEVVPTLFGRFVQVVEREGSRISLGAPRSGLFVRGAGFAHALDRLQAVPGGGRQPLPVRFRPRLPVLLVQGTLLAAGIAAIIVVAVVPV